MLACGGGAIVIGGTFHCGVDTEGTDCNFLVCRPTGAYLANWAVEEVGVDQLGNPIEYL